MERKGKTMAAALLPPPPEKAIEGKVWKFDPVAVTRTDTTLPLLTVATAFAPEPESLATLLIVTVGADV